MVVSWFREGTFQCLSAYYASTSIRLASIPSKSNQLSPWRHSSAGATSRTSYYTRQEGSKSGVRAAALGARILLLHSPVPPFQKIGSNPVHAMLQSVGMGLSTLRDHCHFRTQRTASVDFTIWICFHLLWGDLSLINHRMLNRLVESFLENHKLPEGLEM